MGYKPRKGSNGRSKLHAVRQHRSSKNHAGLSSCIHRRVGGEGLRRVRNYIMKALDFGVESGYLVPANRSYRLLRVSSDLFAKQIGRTTKKTTRCSGKMCERSRCSREREKDDEPNDDEIQSTMRFEDYPVQDARRKRKSRRRSRSQSQRRRRRSRKSRRRRRSGENPEEAREDDDDDDYELDDNTVKKNNTSNDSKNARSKTQDTGKSNAQGSDDISDVSIDEDDTDEDEDKKKDNTTKS